MVEAAGCASRSEAYAGDVDVHEGWSVRGSATCLEAVAWEGGLVRWLGRIDASLPPDPRRDRDGGGGDPDRSPDSRTSVVD